jgi:hypothetical protein
LKYSAKNPHQAIEALRGLFSKDDALGCLLVGESVFGLEDPIAIRLRTWALAEELLGHLAT